MRLNSMIFALTMHYISGGAISDVLEFEDENDWQFATAGQYTTISFTELAPGTQLLNQLAHLGLIFVDGYDQVHTTDSYADGYGLLGQSDTIVVLFADLISAVAVDYPGDIQFTLLLNDDVVYVSGSFPGGGTGFFAGIATDTPFNKVIISDPFRFVSIDDLHFGASTVPADLTHDAVVGPGDLGELLAQWGPCNPDTACSADFDASGVVGPSDLAQLLAAWSKDCNENGEFDHFEIITAGDCNNSGLPDACDIAFGSSLDCNSTGIPDECELEILDPAYVLEDGESDTQAGLTELWLEYPMIWINAFTVQKGGEVIDVVQAAWGVGPASVIVWTDPNDDGHPTDGDLVTLVENIPLTFPIGGPFRTIEIPPTYVGEAGEKFFVGLMVDHDAQQYPAWLDEDSYEPMQSWVDSLGGLDLEWVEPIENSNIFGTWLIRAGSTFNNDGDSNEIPDDCD